jgi:flagellar hook-basal body complex protein FliE
MPIPAIAGALGTAGITSTGSAAGAGAVGTKSFADALGKLVKDVETTGSEANQAIAGMVNKTGDVHDAMIAIQRAEMTLQLTVQIRNKLVQAYNDIMHMPV